MELYADPDAELNSVENKNQMAAFRQCIQNTWKVISDAEMAEYIEDGCDLNFPRSIPFSTSNSIYNGTDRLNSG
jgi:hypothetical protein